MTIRGSCHCGKVACSLDEEMPTAAMECNCSICRRKAYLHHFTTPDRLTVETPRSEIAVYTFKSHNIRHQYCRTCGCAAFNEGNGPKGPMVSVNLRCVEGIDFDALEIRQFDGASL